MSRPIAGGNGFPIRPVVVFRRMPCIVPPVQESPWAVETRTRCGRIRVSFPYWLAMGRHACSRAGLIAGFAVPGRWFLRKFTS